MPAYQLFFVTGEGNAVRKLEQSYDDDAAALQDARALAVNHTIYIWQDARRLAMIAPGATPRFAPFTDPADGASIKRAVV